MLKLNFLLINFVMFNSIVLATDFPCNHPAASFRGAGPSSIEGRLRSFFKATDQQVRTARAFKDTASSARRHVVDLEVTDLEAMITPSAEDLSSSFGTVHGAESVRASSDSSQDNAAVRAMLFLAQQQDNYNRQQADIAREKELRNRRKQQLKDESRKDKDSARAVQAKKECCNCFVTVLNTVVAISGVVVGVWATKKSS